MKLKISPGLWDHNIKQALKYWTLTSQSHPCATATRIIFYDTITVCQYSTINLDFIYKRTMTLVLKKI